MVRKIDVGKSFTENVFGDGIKDTVNFQNGTPQQRNELLFISLINEYPLDFMCVNIVDIINGKLIIFP